MVKFCSYLTAFKANNLVFYSVLKRYDEYRQIADRNNLEPKQLPHIIISSIEHDSVALIAANLHKNNLAGKVTITS
jgi:cysteine sulfinate desulfinase/cysteine desulfurase-like protein